MVLALLVAAGVSLPTTLAAPRPLLYLGGQPGSLDPARIAEARDVQLMLQLYAGLTRMDETGSVYPSLASSWTVSDGGRTYTFHLRDGLRFSDGSPLDATDVRRSWLRLLDPAVASTAPDVLSGVVGATERLAGRVPEGQVGISAPDPRTFVVHLRSPASYFLAITATPATYVVPRTATPSVTWQSADRFVGSGPYVVARRAGDDLVLDANQDYVAGPPPIVEVRWVARLTSDPVSGFSAGSVDLTPVAASDATWIGYDRQLGPQLHRSADLSVAFFGFVTTRPPFNDARVRQAFALALDRRRLVQLADGAAARPASSLVPPALWPAGFTDQLAADPAAARRLLDAAGYADRTKLGRIVVDGSALGVEPAVATWRRELGVTIDVQTMAFADYLPQLATHPPAIYSINWVADYPAPHALYSLLLLPAAVSNYGRWNDPEFVRLLNAASSATDAASQAAAYLAVDRRVQAEAPVIPWSYEQANWLVRGGLRGVGTLTIGLLDFGRVSWGP